MAGVSRNPASFGVKLFEELCHRGYDVVSVNPNVDEVQGRRCFEPVQDIQPPVEGVLLMTSPKAAESVVNDCLEAKVPRVWMHRATGKGSVSAEAVELCRVAGACPFVFLPDTAGIHRFHGFISKIIGHYPRRAAS
jgi:predicted CoA-binding protein